MCTLVLAWRVFEGTPVAVAANRDESLGRPAEPPGVYRADPRAIAPRDASAGGTWLGYNEHGLLVGITNRWVDRAGERSRGNLVADCLGLSSATRAVEHVRRAVETDTYAGFNLVVADARRAALLEYDGDLEVTDFDPGVHVVVNVGADGRFFEPAARPEAGRQQADNAMAVHRALVPVVDDGRTESADAWLDRAAAVLGDHDYGVCVHGDGFGTRSASLVALEIADADPGADTDADPDANTTATATVTDRYWFADGPPCRSRFERVESSL